ncbi:MAG TPA: polysaccharide biosynthesis tyrosine autokinase [Coleofasciculaceae cyanobacterium]
MGSTGDYQPSLPNGNGTQLSELSPIYTPSFSQLGEDKLDLPRILAIARRRAVIIAGVAIAVTSGVVTKVLQQVPNYEGKFQLLVGPASDDNKLERLTGSLSQNAGVQIETIDYETQIQVLWSPQVLSDIVKTIQKRYPDVDYHTLRSKLAIARLGQTKILEVRYQDSDPEKIKFILDQVAEGYVNYSEQEQRGSLQQGLKFVKKQTETLTDKVDKLQKELQTFQQQYNIIDPDSQGKLLTDRFGTIKQQRQDAQTQLVETQRLEQELQSQLAQLGVSTEQAIAASALSEAPRYQALLNELSEIERKIALESARLTEDNPILLSLQDKRNELQSLLQEEAANVFPNGASSVPDNAESLASPSSLRLELTQKLVEATNQKQVLEIRNQAMATAEAQINQQLNQLPYIARRYTDLQRQLKVATESLSRFLAAQETLEIQNAQKTPAWQKISAPEKPQLPISPNVPRGIVLGAIAGLLAGAGAAFLVEKLDKVFHSPDELKDSTGLPLLGTIPFAKELKKNHAPATSGSMPDAQNLDFGFGGGGHAYSASPLLESFRSLHANLHFLSPDRPIRSLVISSSVPAEGKSTTSTFLAQAAATMGQRVLLIDADLRRPQIHVKTDLPNVWGLSNVISSEINVEDVIQRSSMDDNLFVLTAGQIPPDPIRLLCSKKMQTLVERFREMFDLVIFDAPPMLGLADARLLAAHTDGMVMVVGLGRTDRAVLTQVLYGLKTSNTRVLGVVANGVKGYVTGSYEYYNHYYTKAPKRQPEQVEGKSR